jgi:hypothetical protein
VSHPASGFWWSRPIMFCPAPRPSENRRLFVLKWPILMKRRLEPQTQC